MKAAPVMMSKATSANIGMIELNIENNNLVYIKSKAQAMGRVNIITWALIKIARIFMKDKILFDISLNDIKSVEYSEASDAYSYGNLTVVTSDQKYNIQFQEEVNEDVRNIYEYLTGKIN